LIFRRSGYDGASLTARAGAATPEATRRARAALVSIEGSLVLSRVLDDPADFQLTLAELPATLTEPAG
jgi:hypothetical protein